MYQYNISFHDTMHTTKPTGTEIGNISNHLAETQMNYKELAHAVGEAGCAFALLYITAISKQRISNPSS